MLAYWTGMETLGPSLSKLHHVVITLTVTKTLWQNQTACVAMQPPSLLLTMKQWQDAGTKELPYTWIDIKNIYIKVLQHKHYSAL